MHHNLDSLKQLIETKSELTVSSDEFESLAQKYPHIIMQVPGSIELAVKLWKESALADKDFLSDLIEDSDLSEVFNQRLGFPKQGKFFYNKGLWSCDQLSYFKVQVDESTEKQLESLEIKVEVPLKLSETKVATFEPVGEPANTFLDTAAKTTLQLTLGLSLLSFAAFNTNAINSSMSNFFKPKNPVSLALQESIPAAVTALEVQLAKTEHPQLIKLRNHLAGIDKKIYLENMNSPTTDPNPELIEEMILSFYEETNPQHIEKIKPTIKKIASSIIKHSGNKKIDYKVLMGILKVESDFNQAQVSHTLDYSLAQVNYAIWSKELYRVKKVKLNKEKLKTNIDYSIDIMTDILSILEKRHGEDPNWFARYHSSTPSLKLKYGGKVNNVIGSLKLEEYNYHQSQLRELSQLLKTIDVEVAQSNQIDYNSLQELSEKIEAFEKNKAGIQVAIR